MGRPPSTDPLILALFAKLPRPGTVWPVRERKLWLNAAEGVLKLLYAEPEEQKVD